MIKNFKTTAAKQLVLAVAGFLVPVLVGAALSRVGSGLSNIILTKIEKVLK